MQSVAVNADQAGPSSTSKSGWRNAARRGAHAVWVGIVPAVVAVLALRYLVPVEGTGLRGAIGHLASSHALLYGLALYFVLSAVARYWWPRIGGAFAAETKSIPVPEGGRRRDLLLTAAMVLGAALAALALRSFGAQPYRVLGPSMLPTLEPGDLIGGRVHAYRAASGRLPRRGDIVVFSSAAVSTGARASTPAEVLVKRVIGLPGDRISMRGGTPVINGWIVPSCDAGDFLYPLPAPGDSPIHGRLVVEFLEDRAYLAVQAPFANPFADTYVVKPGEVFVLGDNRGHSIDSRLYSGGHGGGVPVEALEARGQWFLIGTQKSGDADFRRLLGPLDALKPRLRVQAFDSDPVSDGVARCLAHRPPATQPPGPPL